MNDGHILMFNGSNQLSWSTYFGGSRHDFLQAMEFKDNKLIVAGRVEPPGTGNPPFPVWNLPGAYNQPSTGITINSGTLSEFEFTGYQLLGVKEPEKAAPGEYLLSPNPASDRLTLGFGPGHPELTLKIVNSLGQQVRLFHFSKTAPSAGYVELDISEIENGLYNLVICNAAGNILSTEKFVKY